MTQPEIGEDAAPRTEAGRRLAGTAYLAADAASEGVNLRDAIIAIETEAAQGAAPPEYLCPNCVTPWKCNGPHIPEGAQGAIPACPECRPGEPHFDDCPVEAEAAQGAAALDRLMELWEQPWSEERYGEAQILLSRIRAAQGAAAPPDGYARLSDGAVVRVPPGWSEEAERQIDDDTERLQEAGSPGSVTDRGTTEMQVRHAEVGGHQDHPWVARDGGPWSPRRRNDLCVKCGGTPDCHPSAPPTTITGPAICADAVKRAYAQGQADAHDNCAFLCHHTGESFVPPEAALAENGYSPDPMLGFDCRHDTILRMDLPDGLQDWQCLCGMFFEPAQNTSHLRTRECSSRAAQGAASLDVAREALEWIAERADQRPDGTYNYDRDALRQKARDALARLAGAPTDSTEERHADET